MYSRTGPANGQNKVRYLLDDPQDSVVSILDSAGTLVVNESYTAFGNRRNPDTWSGAPTNAQKTTIASVTRQGYTWQTALGDMGLNHMNGRVQDAVTGTFLSADLVISDPDDPQNYNLYSYVLNNPMSFTDPSGYCKDGSGMQITVGKDGLEEIVVTGESPSWFSRVAHAFGNMIKRKPSRPQSQKPSVCRSVPTSAAERTALSRGDVDAYYNSRLARGDQYAALALDVVHGRGFMGNAARVWMAGASALSHDLNDINQVNQPLLDLMSGQVSLDLARAHMGATDADRAGVPNLLSANDIRNYHEDYFASRGLPRSTFGGNWPSNSSAYWYQGCETSP